MEVSDRDFAAAQAIVRKHFPELTFPTLVLPKSKRRGITALIALCHLIQNSLAETNDTPGCLELLQARFHEIHENRLELPRPEFREPEQSVLAAAAQTLRQHAIPIDWLNDFSHAIADAKTTRRYATWSALQKHCQLTGGRITVMLATVLGIQNSQAWEGIQSIGIAASLRTILLNLKQEWAAGRLALPLEALVQFAMREEDLFSPQTNDRRTALIQFEVKRADALLDAGTSALPWLASIPARLFAGFVIEQLKEDLNRIESAGADFQKINCARSTLPTIRQFRSAFSIARGRRS
jgi:phytoene/squalene synthetase